MFQRQRVVETPGAHEATEQDHAVDDEREQDPRNDNGVDTDRQGARQGDMRAGIALAGDRGKAFACQPDALGQKCGQCKEQENDRKHRCPRRIVLRTDDGQR